MVCATPRSGSSYLCGLLANTKIAGNPEEYYWKDNILDGYKKWKVNDFAGYFKKSLEAGSTYNRVFGAKIMWGYIDDFIQRLKKITRSNFSSDKLLFEFYFPNLKFIYIWRKDFVAQAVSWTIASQTGIWFSGSNNKPDKKPKYNFQIINNLVKEIKTHNKAWNDWFTENQITPLKIKYEDLDIHTNKVMIGVMNLLDLDLPSDTAIKASYKRQTDSIKKEWTQRFLSEQKTSY